MIPLSGDELRAWRAFVRCTSVLLTRLDHDVQMRAGLSLVEFSVLRSLSEGPEEGVRMTQLAEYTVLSKSRLSHCVDRLVDLGLVKREPVPSDKRGLAAVITDAGRDHFRSHVVSHDHDVRRLALNALGPDRLELFEQMCGSIADRVDRDGDAAADEPFAMDARPTMALVGPRSSGDRATAS